MFSYKSKFSKKIQLKLLELSYLNNKLIEPDKWLIALINFEEESPGSTKTQCQLMAGGGNPRDSATENKPPHQGKGEKVW